MKVAGSEEEEAGRVALACLGELGPMSLDSPLLQVNDTIFTLKMLVFRSLTEASGVQPQR